MHFIDVDRLLVRARVLPRLQPLGIVPLVSAEFRDDRTGARPQLHLETERVRLQQRVALPRANFVFIYSARAHVRDEQLPQTGAAARLHRVLATVPVVERTDDADPLRIRRPDRKTGARQAVHECRVRAELVVQRVVISLAEQIEIVVGELRREVIRVVPGGRGAVAIPDLQCIRLQRASMRHAAFEQASRVQRLELESLAGVAVPVHSNLHGIGFEHAHDANRSVARPRIFVVTEQRSRLGMTSTDQRVDVGCAEFCYRGHGLSLTHRTGRPATGVVTAPA